MASSSFVSRSSRTPLFHSRAPSPRSLEASNATQNTNRHQPQFIIDLPDKIPGPPDPYMPILSETVAEFEKVTQTRLTSGRRFARGKLRAKQKAQRASVIYSKNPRHYTARHVFGVEIRVEMDDGNPCERAGLEPGLRNDFVFVQASVKTRQSRIPISAQTTLPLSCVTRQVPKSLKTGTKVIISLLPRLSVREKRVPPELSQPFKDAAPLLDCSPTNKTSNIIKNVKVIYVKRKVSLLKFLNLLNDVEENTAELFLDAEGNNHGWSGELSTIQASLAAFTGTSWVLDVKILGVRLIFDTKNRYGVSLREFLRNPKIPAIWFDIRQDNAALVGQCNVKLGFPIDLQLLVQGAFYMDSMYLSGLSTCIKYLLRLPEEEKESFDKIKSTGRQVIGREFSLWLKRPLPQILIDYAAGDTVYMPYLYHLCMQRLKGDRRVLELVIELSEKRAMASGKPDFVSSVAIAPPEFAELFVSRTSIVRGN